MDSKIFLGRYRVSAEEIGAAGEPGKRPISYEGEEIASGKKVVVKMIPAWSLDNVMREQLEENAIAAKKLRHVNIHALHDFGVEDNCLVYVTEDFQGTLLDEWVNTYGPMPVGPVLRIASQVVSALAAADSHRIVHRAINPSNIMLVPGESAEGEWPLVRVLHFVGVTRKSSSAEGTGTAFEKSLPYESPEQLKQGVVDFRSEIYSLGATMWFLLTGAPPPMASEASMAAQSKGGPISDKLSAVPENIRRLLARMLSVDPSARPREPLAFSLELKEGLAATGPREQQSRPAEVPANSLKGPIGMPASSLKGPIGMPAPSRIPMKAVVLGTLFLVIAALAAWILPGYLRQRRSVPAKEVVQVQVPTNRSPGPRASPTNVPKVAPVASLPPARSEPPQQQQSPEPAVKVTLLSFTPMVGTPGEKDFKVATLTFKLEASVPVAVTEANFYVDSIAFDVGPTHNPPIPLLIHPGFLLGPPRTKVDPEHPIQRIVWLKSQENLFPNWSLAYNQTENGTFRWTIAGQPPGGSIVKPLHKAWTSPQADPEVRRAEPAEPDVRRAAPASPAEVPADVAPHRSASPNQPTKQSRDAATATPEAKSRKAKPSESEPTILLKVPSPSKRD
jgi:eukaryotic-like serine/threonine-protein kinase